MNKQTESFQYAVSYGPRLKLCLMRLGGRTRCVGLRLREEERIFYDQCAE
ncbi:MAG: hypothetical protein JWP28_2116 [Phenylobacterium sp.]|jgi:hypothetical protein|nr:hypothetical protein [Phenylobacterium sp.]